MAPAKNCDTDVGAVPANYLPKGGADGSVKRNQC